MIEKLVISMRMTTQSAQIKFDVISKGAESNSSRRRANFPLETNYLRNNS